MLVRVISIAALLTTSTYIEAWADETSSSYGEDAQLIYRPKGNSNISELTSQSGYCCLVLDVTKLGTVENVRVNYCSHETLAMPIKTHVRKFMFSPATINGQPVIRRNKRYNQDYFKFKSNYSDPIPGPDGYMERKDRNVEIPPRPQSREEAIEWTSKYFNTEMICEWLIS